MMEELLNRLNSAESERVRKGRVLERESQVEDGSLSFIFLEILLQEANISSNSVQLRVQFVDRRLRGEQCFRPAVHCFPV